MNSTATTASSTPGIGLVGFGWMGQAHSRAYRNIPVYFPESGIRPELVVVCDTDAQRAALARDNFGYRESTGDWQAVIDHPDVEVVDITAPNALHERIAVAAARAGKHVFCEKPVGVEPAATARIEQACREAGVVTGCGYNYRWAPMVQHAHALVREGRIGELTHYRGRFFTMYGRDRLGLLSWRFSQEQAGYGVLMDIMSHAIDMALHLAGPIKRLVATKAIFVMERPLPKASGTHFDRGAPGDPTGPVTNEDYVGALVEFANGARGVLETDRSIFGPQSDIAFEINGSKGALGWSHEKLNQLQLYLPEESPADGFTEVLAGDAFPHHGNIVPGGGNSLGYEDLKLIEALEYLKHVRAGTRAAPDFADALAVAKVQEAMIRSWASGQWESVDH